ncbi:DUF6759 domain-containing protein [Chryseobacterium sp. ISL-6]|uniref:DUF6759 domain-containing protein n=1 Tax=Chryseobacterium sp. ISL-6 TaxID=2819143 RepID=UPI001BE901B2|nr:DUF6759 domain-containing protein [Chryseobacterium sp. ISL-6]MBT2623670.1 hypothetical protein [Chryseobacterium sp. ISL-6]
MIKQNWGMIVLLAFSFLCIGCGEERNIHNILRSTDVREVQNYLDNAREDDPKVIVLKKRIIELKNKEWVKGAADAKPMASRPVTMDQSLISEIDHAEFEKLLQEDDETHRKKTTNLLNEIFNDSRHSPNSVLLVKNESGCNMILRIANKQDYKLAIPAKGENFIVLEKGKYNITGNICGSSYEQIKDLNKGICLTLRQL